ncbi:hypothetical protein CWS43_14360 [Rahnella sp. AA]|uniref:tetratricopeptide repeat protein n=1 Tax=Rahnella sp. AA TaxID=2057180 RepID=UPI000C342D10|nr:tetratricopeptide repeat protein [Rahnella sp. AA]PKE29924.1 hypothetical protein CWS43_14360 [Rahnella sp. AA]
MKTKTVIQALSVVCLAGNLLMFSAAAHAMGDDSDEKKTPDCPKGQIYDSKTKSCMVDKGSMISDQDKTQYAYHLAKTGRYQEALTVLDTLKDLNTKEAWNYRGYATRKLGRTDEGISYYQKSIAIDANYAKVREYLGEAYMIKGRPDLAKAQLATIKGLCGTGCEEYRDLSAAIAGHPES